MKKILSLALALCLCLSLLPTVALAADGTELTQANISGYTTLTGGSYYLGDDITLTSTLTVTDTVTLDLNGKTLTGAKGSDGNAGIPGDKGGTAITVTSGGELTITDTGTTGSIVGGNGGIGGYFSSGGGGGAAITVNGGSLTVFGGRIVGGDGSSSSNGGGGGSGGSGIEIAGGTVKINGGNIVGGNGSDGRLASYRGGSGGAGGNGLLIKGGSVSVGGNGTISGGTPGNGGNCTDGSLGGGGGFGGAGGNGLFVEDGSVSIDGGIFRGTNGANGGSENLSGGNGGNGGNGGSGLRIEGGSVNLGGGEFHGANCGSGGTGSTSGSNGAAGRDIFLSGTSNIQLTDDITLANTLICKDATLTLDLNGHVLSFAETKKLQLEETTAEPKTAVTLIDSDPTATHTDTTLPKGGVIKGDVLLTRGSSTATELVTLHANGGTVTGTATLCETGVIDCTNGTPTAFMGGIADKYGVTSAGSIQGGIFYGTIKDQYLAQGSANVTGKTITFMNGNTRYAFEVVRNNPKAIAPTEPTAPNDYTTFGGWYEKDDSGAFKDTMFGFNTDINKNITLYAKWEKIDDFAWLLPVLGALDKEPFDDVKSGDWFYDDVHYVNEYRLMTGTGSRTFSPDAPVTRGMVMTILARREGIRTDRYSPWYAAGVEWAVANGISDGSNPEAPITREELATMLYRYAKLKGYDLSGTPLTGFSDAGSVSGYAVSAMQWAVNNGLINGAAGVNAGKLLPKATATRAQLAAMLHRFFG